MTARAFAATLFPLLLTAAVAVSTIPAPGLADVKTTIKTEYYTVSGRSLTALDKSLTRNAPILNGNERALGQARLRFKPDITAVQTERGCAVKDSDLTLEVVMILPRWVDEKRSGRELRGLWRSFAGFVRQHEERHVQIALDHAKQLERMFTRVPTAPNCKLLRARLKSGADRILSQHQRAQRKFDERDQARVARAARQAASRMQTR